MAAPSLELVLGIRQEARRRRGIRWRCGSGSTQGVSRRSRLEFDEFRIECLHRPGSLRPRQDGQLRFRARGRSTNAIKHLGGDPNVLYDVKLRVRGNTEPNSLRERQARAGALLYRGWDVRARLYRVHAHGGGAERSLLLQPQPHVSHLHFVVDYEVVIPMKGGTTLTFEVNGGKSVPDGHGVSNQRRAGGA